MSGDLAEVRSIIDGHGGSDPQPPVVGLFQLHGVPQVGTERLPADGQHAQAGVLTPEPGNL